MDEVEEERLFFDDNNLWKPPIKLSDCSSEYLKDNPIPYHLLKNPFKFEKVENTTPEYEGRVWSRLGLLNDTDTRMSSISDASTQVVSPENDPSIYFEKCVAPIRSKREVKRDRKAERKSKLSRWFYLPRGDFSKENLEDREIIARRNVLSNELHPRKADGRRTHFHVGTIVDDPGSFYDRIPRKQRKKNLVDELLANAEYMKKQRRQYAKIQKEKQEKRAAMLRKKKQQQKKAGRTKTVEING